MRSKLIPYIRLFILMVFSSEIYFYPMDGDLKFSAGIVALDLLILIMDDIPEIILVFLYGIGVFLTRVIADFLLTNNGFHEVLSFNVPSLFYYITFGMLILIINIKKIRNSFFKTIIVLAMIDSISNVAEEILREGIDSDILKIIIIVGFVRSFVAYVIYFSYSKQRLYILNKEHQRRYTQLNMLISNVQAEMFYLKKSMKEIEAIMGESYNLYNMYKNNMELREKTLNIAREVHEVKKDYFRVVKGFDSFIDTLETEDTMILSSILAIIKDNTAHILKGINKKIKVKLEYEVDYTIKPYFSLFVIINNLIINSIDACSNGDVIKVVIKEADEEGNVLFEISDTGGGIDKDIIPYIFNPGFTTKYDEFSGKSSTGIGLCHVKNVTEELGGKIEVRSEVNIGTTFILRIPRKQLEGV